MFDSQQLTKCKQTIVLIVIIVNILHDSAYIKNFPLKLKWMHTYTLSMIDLSLFFGKIVIRSYWSHKKRSKNIFSPPHKKVKWYISNHSYITQLS